MAAHSPDNPYPAAPAVDKGELPDPFAAPDGGRISETEQWPGQARRWLDTIIGTEYGGMPPKPECVLAEALCHNRAKRLPGKPGNWTYRIHCNGGEKPFTFCVRVLFPHGSDSMPAIINGDACWWYISDELVQRVLDRGCALVIFNRTEMAEDLGHSGVTDKTKRSGGIYDVFPGRSFGALSAWAWGYHRCVDFLHQLPFIDTARIAITGHSRGGKTTLVAGATDERIALVNDNASCAGGSPVFRYVGDGGETLNILDVFPSWFGPEMQQYAGREDTIPFDQHCLLAAIAPRLLLLTFALDDRWSNPEGMVQSARAAGEVYRFLGLPENLAFHLRAGKHSHALQDWDVLLDFIDWKWNGRESGASYNIHPYRHLRPAFSWKAPGT